MIMKVRIKDKTTITTKMTTKIKITNKITNTITRKRAKLNSAREMSEKQ